MSQVELHRVLAQKKDFSNAQSGMLPVAPASPMSCTGGCHVQLLLDIVFRLASPELLWLSEARQNLENVEV